MKLPTVQSWAAMYSSSHDTNAGMMDGGSLEAESEAAWAAMAFILRMPGVRLVARFGLVVFR